MSFATNLRCRECHREYPLKATHVCEFCFGPVEVTYDYDGIRKSATRASIAAGPPSLWRYKDFLPVEAENAIDIGAGFTPLVHAKNLGKLLGLNKLYIKNDTVNPTWSFKDRVVAVAASRARELGYDKLACAKAIVAFSEAEGADGHCEPAAAGIRGERVFDWLDEHVLA